eukprot:84596-Pyramimonas_sp.AAC.1
MLRSTQEEIRKGRQQAEQSSGTKYGIHKPIQLLERQTSDIREQIQETAEGVGENGGKRKE